MRYLILLSLCLPLSTVSAHNNLFFPGDAYFSSEWKVNKYDSTQESMSLQYRRLSSVFMACGYAGCEKFKIEAIPQLYRDNLQKVNALLLAQHQERANEGTIYAEDDSETKYKYFDLFIHNKGYDYEKYGLGYKFNENWESLQTKEAKRGHAIYDGIGSVVWDWQHAKKVKGLTLSKFPKNLEAFMGVKTPIESKAKDLSFVITIGGRLRNMADTGQAAMMLEHMSIEDFRKYKETVRDLTLQFFVVDEKIRFFERTAEGIVEKPWETKQNTQKQ